MLVICFKDSIRLLALAFFFNFGFEEGSFPEFEVFALVFVGVGEFLESLFCLFVAAQHLALALSTPFGLLALIKLKQTVPEGYSVLFLPQLDFGCFLSFHIF